MSRAFETNLPRGENRVPQSIFANLAEDLSLAAKSIEDNVLAISQDAYGTHTPDEVANLMTQLRQARSEQAD